MAEIRPFAALRPSFENAAHVACLPYDVMNRREASEMADNNKMSFLRVVRSEIELPHLDAYDEQVYRKAKENLRLFEEEGILIQDSRAHLYVYSLTMEGRTQRGIVAGVCVDEYLENRIKKHEFTRKDKEIDRIRHFLTTSAHTEPVFLVYRKNEEIKKLIDEISQGEPVADFTSEDGITHVCRVIEDEKTEAKLVQLFSEIDSLYIADGHHRSASAAKIAQMRREQDPDYTGEEEFNYLMAVLFDEEELLIMDYNRVVKDLNGLSEEEFLEKVRELGRVEEKDSAVRPEKKGSFGMLLGEQWYLVHIHEELLQGKDSLSGLDVSLLQDYLLSPVLGIDDPRTDQRIDFVGGIRGLKELERRVHEGMKVAFSMYPTSMRELIEVADSGRTMPPKSTWFEPKLRSGLFVHKI